MALNADTFQRIIALSHVQQQQLFTERNGIFCSGIPTNLMLTYQWLPVNCTHTFNKSAFICEHNLRSSIISRNSNHFWKMVNKCQILEVSIKELCVSLIGTEFRNNSKLIHIPESVSDLKPYITAWTRQHINSQTSIVSSIYILYGVYGAQTHNCSCFKTQSLFYREKKEWYAASCSCSDERIKYVLTIIPARNLVNNCSQTDYKCDDGTCILNIYVCDSNIECPDGSDERRCHHMCQPLNDSLCLCNPSQFLCSSGGCISIAKVCNGLSDCEDLSDERSCVDQSVHARFAPVAHSNGCPDGWSLCNVFHSDCFPRSKICVSERWMDIPLYCPNCEHLKFCSEHQCPSMFKCHRTYCIPTYMVCDGKDDCPLSEDENNCTDMSCPGDCTIHYILHSYNYNRIN